MRLICLRSLAVYSSEGTDPKNEEEIVRLFARPNAFQRFACLRASPSSFQMFPHWMPIKTDPALPLVV